MTDSTKTAVQTKIWWCKIGEAKSIPPGADWPMRQAVETAYYAITGDEPKFVFSGWGAKLTEPERAVVEDRMPSPPTKKQLWRSVARRLGEVFAIDVSEELK